MLQFRKDSRGFLRRIANGERFVLSHRGRPAARLEPVYTPEIADPASDPFLNIAGRAVRSPKGETSHVDIDHILYGRH